MIEDKDIIKARVEERWDMVRHRIKENGEINVLENSGRISRYLTFCKEKTAFCINLSHIRQDQHAIMLNSRNLDIIMDSILHDNTTDD